MDKRFYSAVDNVGRAVLLIKDNKIIGEGFAVASGDGMVSIEMRDDRAKALIENSVQVKTFGEKWPEKKYKWSLFKFYQFNGEYYRFQEPCETLIGVRVVDKTDLSYGMVPDSFKNVEGYNSAFTEYTNKKSEK